MHTSNTKIHDRAATRSPDDSRRFGCSHRSDVNLIHHKCSDELRLSDGRNDFKNGFIGENNRAFPNGVYIASEAKICEMVEEGG